MKNEYDRQVRNLKSRFDARIVTAGERKHIPYSRMSMDMTRSEINATIQYETEQVVAIKMGERDLEKFFDYLDWLENDSRHYPIQYDENRFIQYLHMKMDEEYHEKKLRDQNPALRDAWEQYQALKILLEN